ncbi:MAG: tRNA (N6-isopentenyl adenosine(37)-C2)-methylthiotransferase MiaB [Polyangiaceae bacterium]
MSRFSIVTFGCQMNEHDSARMGEILRASGHTEVASPVDADIVVLNTCSVRDKAEQKLRSEVGRLALRKREQRDFVIVVSGCVGQQEGEKLLKAAPEVDLVIGPDNIPLLPALLADIEHGGPKRAITEFDLDAPRFLSATVEGGHAPPSTYVTVMKGCNERCSFCIVPYTRGAERYRGSHEILDEVERLVEGGVREITLLGQTVNSYRDPDRALPKAEDAGRCDWAHTSRQVAETDESEFPSLLDAIAARAPKLRRLRYTSPHPRHLTRALISAHRRLDVLAKHLHLPVQSGSNAMLKRMIRRYTREEYIERITALRDAVSGIGLSTDVIVGFPGETRAQFDETVSLVEEVGFLGLFGFKYSPRPGTPSLKLGDDVTEEEKAERLEILFERHDRMRRAHLASLVGTEQVVLVEGRKKDGAYTGRTERNEIVHFGARTDLTGELVKVRIALAFKNSLGAEIEDESIRIAVTDLPKVAAHAEDGMLQAAEPSDSIGRSSRADAAPKRALPVI